MSLGQAKAPTTPTAPQGCNPWRPVAFLIAGGILLALADVAPGPVVAFTGLLALASIINRPDQVKTLTSGFNTLLGQP